MYWFYMGLFVVFLIAEALTFNLMTIWMAAASLVTSIYAWFFPNQIIPQAFIFIVLSIILIIATKPLTGKFLKQPEKTNADSLIGKTGIVTVEIDSVSSLGQVKVKGQIWSAKSAENITISENEKVEIKAIEGVKLIVSRLS